jgi:hypothetical protein
MPKKESVVCQPCPAFDRPFAQILAARISPAKGETAELGKRGSLSAAVLYL